MKRLALLICLAVLFVLPAHAQEELPISEGFVFKWENEIIFPMGARFRLTLSRPVESLRTVTFTIAVSGQEPATVEMDLEQPLATGPSHTEVDYVWTIPEGMPLHVFSNQDVIFEWNATDDAGQTARVRDALLFQDERITWVQGEDPLGFIHLTAAADGPSPEQIRQSVLLPYNLMSANAGRVQEFDILLYPANLDPSGCESVQDEKTNGAIQAAVGPVSGTQIPCDPDRARSYFEASGLEVVQSDGTNTAGAQAALVRFLTQRFYQSLWGETDVPDWFLAGLSTFYQPTSKAPLLLPVRDAARVDSLLPLAQMVSRRPEDRLWQAQSYAMVLYLADQMGVEGLFTLAKALGSSDSFQAAYEEETGQGLNALLPSVQRWVFSSAAASAFDYTPYQPQTPTPTPSQTHTPFPPTATPTATASATLTVTPSVTGALSQTPSNTPTLTRTPTPRPATVTPRPAGSLFAPTPVPTPSALENPVNRLGIITVLMILLAILALIYWLTNRRRDESV